MGKIADHDHASDPNFFHHGPSGGLCPIHGRDPNGDHDPNDGGHNGDGPSGRFGR